MGLKDLIFANPDKEGKSKKEDKPSFQNKFAGDKKEGGKKAAFLADEVGQFDFGKTQKVADWKTQPTTIVSPESCKPHMDKVVELYEKGFEGLNQEGYDFYEFYKSIMETGADNPAMYKMALTMAKTMDKTVSKDSLVKQAEFYLKEITEVYKNYVNAGNTKRKELLGQKEQEEESLRIKLGDIEKELTKLNSLKSNYESSLSTIDSKYSSELHEIDCKLEANDVAKRGIFESIHKVIRGINTNL